MRYTSFSVRLGAAFSASLVMFSGPMARGSGATVPAGYLSVEAAAGTGTVHEVTPLSVPLRPLAGDLPGAVSGRVSEVQSKVLVCGSAGWTAGALVGGEEPFFLWVKSGAGAGHAFRITANTSDAVTLDTRGPSLASLGVAEGDRWEISRGWTLRGLFGSSGSGVVGGSSSDFAAGRTDKVMVNDAGGAVLTCYFDEPSGKWKRAGSSSSQDALPISPTAGVFYYRIAATPLAFAGAGEVAAMSLRRVVSPSGGTLVSPGYPVDTTIVSLGLHLLTEWRKAGDPGVTSTNADRLVVKKEASNQTVSLYYDRNSPGWKSEGTEGNWDAYALPAGTAVMLMRSGRGNAQVWHQEMPAVIPQP